MGDPIYDARRMKFHRMIAVDFDNTLFHSHFPATGEMIDGARQALEAFRKAGLLIIIHTARVSDYWQRCLDGYQYRIDDARHEVEKILTDNKIPWDEVWDGRGKPPCWLSIDDRAITFDTWEKVEADVLARLSALKIDSRETHSDTLRKEA